MATGWSSIISKNIGRSCQYYHTGTYVYDSDSSFYIYIYIYFGCRYLVAISALAFVYSLVQSLRHIHQFRRAVDPAVVQSPGIGVFNLYK
jgi:hypothetical protein